MPPLHFTDYRSPAPTLRIQHSSHTPQQKAARRRPVFKCNCFGARGERNHKRSQPSLRTEQEEIKHTPRPWYRGEIEIDSGGKAIGSAYILSAEQRGSTLANARLMAAAPDLLEALKYARATFGDTA